MKSNFFTSERAVLSVVLLNAVVIFLQECGVQSPLLAMLDALCTLYFVAEMVIKHLAFGPRTYWRSGWNALDGVVTIVTLPSLFAAFWPSLITGTGFLQVLRALRLLKLLRTARFFPNIKAIVRGFRMALRDSAAILLAFVLMIFIVALINCSLFKAAAPQYFGTPLDACYSMFRLFTVEGWYEIPDAIGSAVGAGWVHLVRGYFCLLLIGGGIIGMSLLNSIFVDAMVSDNNDDIKAQLDRLEEKLDALQKSVNQDADK